MFRNLRNILVVVFLAAASIAAAQTVVIDGPGPEGSGFTASSGWTATTAAGSYNGQSLWASRWDGDPIALQVWKNPAPNAAQLRTATWDLNPSLPANRTKRVEVWAWWAAGSNRTSGARYNVFHDGNVTTVPVNQRLNGGKWNLLGTFEFYRNTGVSSPDPVNQVKMWNNFDAASGSVVSADAVKFVILPDEYIADNGDDTFSASANWTTSTATAGYFGANYAIRATGAVSDKARFDASLSEAGAWTVYARWTAASNRATAAPYVVTHAAGATTVNVNQTTGNGAWVALGTWNFNAGPNKVELSCWTTSGQYVVADAVRWVKQ